MPIRQTERGPSGIVARVRSTETAPELCKYSVGLTGKHHVHLRGGTDQPNPLLPGSRHFTCEWQVMAIGPQDDQRQEMVMPRLLFNPFGPCAAAWHAEHSVIRFSSESEPEWLRNS